MLHRRFYPRPDNLRRAVSSDSFKMNQDHRGPKDSILSDAEKAAELKIKCHYEDIIKELETQVETMKRNAFVLTEENKKLQEKNNSLLKQLMKAKDQAVFAVRQAESASMHVIGANQDSPSNKNNTIPIPFSQTQEEDAANKAGTGCNVKPQLTSVDLAASAAVSVPSRSRILVSVTPTFQNQQVIFKGKDISLQVRSSNLQNDGSNLTISKGETIAAAPTIWVFNNSNSEAQIRECTRLAVADFEILNTPNRPLKNGVDYTFGKVKLELVEFGQERGGSTSQLHSHEDPKSEQVWVKVGRTREQASVIKRREGMVQVRWHSTGSIDWVATESCQATATHFESIDLTESLFDKDVEIAALEVEKRRLSDRVKELTETLDVAKHHQTLAGQRSLEIDALRAQKEALSAQVAGLNRQLEGVKGQQVPLDQQAFVDSETEKLVLQANIAEKMRKEFEQALNAHEEELLMEHTIKLEHAEEAYEKALWEKDREIATLLSRLQEYRTGAFVKSESQCDDQMITVLNHSPGEQKCLASQIQIKQSPDTDTIKNSKKKMKPSSTHEMQPKKDGDGGYLQFIPYLFGFNVNKNTRKRKSAVDPDDL